MAYDPYASSASKKGKGGQFATFDWNGKKVEFYKIEKAGDYSIDIIPFKITSKKHPAIKDGASIGDEVYSMDFWTHGNVGPRKMSVICPAETWGKPCPVCEAREQISRELGPKSKEAGDLRPKHRVIYNVVDPDDSKETIKVFEASFPLFEQGLVAMAGAKGRKKGKDYIHFGDIEEGWTISFTAVQESFNGSKYFKFESFDLEKREEAHDKSLIKEAISFDEHIISTSYEDLAQLMTGDAEADDEDEEEAPAKAPTKKPADDDDDEDDAPPKCPAKGKTFGKDYDRSDDACGDCDVWKDCKIKTRESRE